MNLRNIVLTAGLLIAGTAALTIGTKAQGPLYDRVMVNLPYTVTIGDRVLQPGDYVIQQLRSDGGGGRVLLIYSNNGMKFETSAMTIPALDNRTPENTKVILHHYGPDYYFDKVWIQGKDYGYEFPLPDSVKSRQRERAEPMTVAARYEATPETSVTESTTTTATTTAPATSTTTESTTAKSTTTESTTTESTTARSTTESAATPKPVTPTESAPNTNQSAANTNQVTPSYPSTTEASRTASNRESRTRTMPETSANWMMMLLGGGFLSSAGLLLRRSR